MEAVALFLLDRFRQHRITFSNELAHVASYVRELPISLERMYENTIDGEHLPYLHSASFSDMNILDSGNWGWRATLNQVPRSPVLSMEVCLTLDRERQCWKTKTTRGFGKGSEVWTHAIALSEHRTKVVVDFYVPKLPNFLKPMYAKKLVSLYERLYDEDIAMMSLRQERLDEKKQLRASEKSKVQGEFLNLGDERQVREALPLIFELNKKSYRLIAIDNKLVAHSTTCPHMLGPLDHSPVTNGTIECPWHGYRFDIKTGACISGQKCSLGRAPRVSIDSKSNEVTVKLY